MPPAGGAGRRRRCAHCCRRSGQPAGREFCGSDRAGGRHGRHAHRTRGNVRAGRCHPALRNRGRRGGARQRHGDGPCGLCLHQGPQPGDASDRPARIRHGRGQHREVHWRPDSLRWLEAVWSRARRGALRALRISRGQIRLLRQYRGLKRIGPMTINVAEISKLDRASVLHPFTQLADFASGRIGDPTIVETGKGIRIQDATGKEFIDGFAGLYCVNVGYGRTEVAEAIARQAYRLAHYHSYAAHTTDELAILSDRLVRMAPGKMSKVFYGMSGSDANETNAKLVWYYNNLRGKPKKKKIISRERGYHGSSVISGSMTGMSFYHDYMDLPVPGIIHTGVPHYYWGAEPGETEEAFSARRAAELDALIEREGADTVGALIAEPVLGTGGITP